MSNLNLASTANNARLLEPPTVAELFVEPPFFKDLFSLRHHLLVGPRGSGKTTLLKMLRIPGIANWNSPSGKWARENLPFVSIFVPADTSWTERINSQVGPLPDAIQRSYIRAAHTLLLLRAIVDAFIERTRIDSRLSTLASAAYRPVQLPRTTEIELCERLSASWNTRNTMPTLRGLKTALSSELMLLGKALNEGIDNGEWSAVAAVARRISLPVSETISHSIDVFQEVTEAEDVKWAVLFDELEITPDWFQEDVLRRFRSTDSRLIFKAAITPCGPTASQVGGIKQPHRVDDYHEIPLWYSEHNESNKFCHEFWLKLLQHKKIIATSPTAALGRSLTEDDTAVGSRSGRYAKQGQWMRSLSSLARKDASFSEYLHRRGVNLRRPQSIDPDKMDSVVRKVAPIAVYRDYFLADRTHRSSPERMSKRSRKVVALYSGAKSIFRITEGNPRWFLSLVGQLVDKWQRQGRTISRQDQATLVEEFSERFLATVAAYPNPVPRSTTNTGFPKLTITDLLDQLGSFAFTEIVGKQFRDDPRLSIRIDLDDPVIDSLLTVAINSGALVLSNSAGAPNFIEKPFGRVVRLSHHLAPRYRIPTRSGRHVSLRKVLDGTADDEIAAQGSIEFDNPGA